MSNFQIDTPTLPPLPVRLRQSAEEVAEFPHPSFCDHLHDASAVMREAAAEIERLAAALAAAQEDARQLREALRTLVKSNPDPFHYLDRGIGTKSKDGQAWLAARAAIDAAQKEKP